MLHPFSASVSLLSRLSSLVSLQFDALEYPWVNVEIAGWPQLRRWLFLPDYAEPPLASLLIGEKDEDIVLADLFVILSGDFFQLLFACQQWRVFKYEGKEKHRPFVEAGGSNAEISGKEDVYKDNPTWDFVITKRHWLDRVKYAVFMYSAWFVLSIVYLAGTTRISLLGLGYLIACFYFFWYGQDFLTKRVAVMLRLWNYLIYYCFSVIFIKTCLQVAVCIFLHPLMPCEGEKRSSSFCTFIDLLVPCLKSDLIPPSLCPTSSPSLSQQCGRSATDANLFMDGFCLIFLLLQKRIFGSYYWEHIVAELRSQSKLASQGAVLFNDISRRRLDEDAHREEQTVKKITLSLKRITEQQRKLDQSESKAAQESAEHFEGLFLVVGEGRSDRRFCL